jgi:hypothetical protein
MGSNDSRENGPFRKEITADELVDGSRHASEWSDLELL